MSRWFRMYADVLDDPKVQRLPPDLFKVWVNLLCLASRNDGVLPSLEDMSFALRMSQDVTRDMVVTLLDKGLLDDDNGLTPHNWNERQFKSDGAEDAKIRKRRQREREKEANVTPDVTVTGCDSHDEVTPPEQNRTDQNRTDHNKARDDDFEPEHRKVVQDILEHHDDELDDWKRKFLVSIKWKPELTRVQRNSLETIIELVNPQFGKGRAMLSVARGTPEYEAWLGYYRKRNGNAKFYEARDTLTVPTEYPPQEQAA